MSIRYGGDGLDTEKLLKVQVPILKMKGTPSEAVRRWCKGRGCKEEEKKLERVFGFVKDSLAIVHYENTHLYIPFDCEVELGPPSRNSLEKDPETLMRVVDNTCNEIIKLIGDEDAAAQLILVVRSEYAFARVHIGYSFEKIKASLQAVVHRVGKARIDAGAMCGAISATSIGEPATQMVSFCQSKTNMYAATNPPHCRL